MSKTDAWSASAYNKNASFVYSQQYTSAVLDLLQAQPGERILDIGCGSGEVTLELERVVGSQGHVLGTDASANMIDKAHENGVANAMVCDMRDLERLKDTEAHFDAVFSNAALHWVKENHAAVLQGVKSVLKPGGRFVAEMGGFLNIVGLRASLHRVLRARGIDPEPLDPWYFPSAEEYKDLLEAQSFKVHHMSLNPRITPLPGQLVGWLQTFARTTVLAGLNDTDAKEVMEEVQRECAVDFRDGRGNWALMYVRLRFSATVA